MRHIKSYHLYESGSEGGSDLSKTKIEIHIEGKSPDGATYGCKAVGIGKSPREAAMFALQVSCVWLVEYDHRVQIRTLDEFYDQVFDFGIPQEELEEILQMLEKGKIKEQEYNHLDFFDIKPRSFFSSYDTVDAEAYVDKALPDATLGGFIIDDYVNE